MKIYNFVFGQSEFRGVEHQFKVFKIDGELLNFTGRYRHLEVGSITFEDSVVSLRMLINGRGNFIVNIGNVGKRNKVDILIDLGRYWEMII